MQLNDYKEQDTFKALVARKSNLPTGIGEIDSDEAMRDAD